MMFFWDEKSIRWMDEAANYTGYYQKLAERISPYLRKDDTVCELGCGTGYLACVLAPKIAHITAVDISDLAIAKFREKLTAAHIDNITPVAADWRTWQPQGYSKNGKFDVVLLSYFNALIRDWPQVLKLAQRGIIAVLPNEESPCRQHNPLFNDEEGRETVSNVIPFLKAKSIPYQLLAFDSEFGQPVRDWTDAFEYLSHYYVGDEAGIKDYLHKHLVEREGRYYLPKLKKSGIIIIDLLKK